MGMRAAWAGVWLRKTCARVCHLVLQRSCNTPIGKNARRLWKLWLLQLKLMIGAAHQLLQQWSLAFQIVIVGSVMQLCVQSHESWVPAIAEIALASALQMQAKLLPPSVPPYLMKTFGCVRQLWRCSHKSQRQLTHVVTTALLQLLLPQLLLNGSQLMNGNRNNQPWLRLPVWLYMVTRPW